MHNKAHHPLIKSSATNRLQKSPGQKSIDQRSSQGAHGNSGGAAEIQSSDGRGCLETAILSLHRSLREALRERVA